jgi:hypothetical protein
MADTLEPKKHAPRGRINVTDLMDGDDLMETPSLHGEGEAVWAAM